MASGGALCVLTNCTSSPESGGASLETGAGASGDGASVPSGAKEVPAGDGGAAASGVDGSGGKVGASDPNSTVERPECDSVIPCVDDACSGELECVGGRCVEEGAVLVANDSELATAIADDAVSNILVAPGAYGLSDMVQGVDRTARPLTIQGLDPSDRPRLVDATQSLVGTRHVAFRNLSFVRSAALGGIWFADGGGSGSGGDAHDITIECADFSAPDPGDQDNTNSDPSYSSGMTSLFRFSNYATHNYVLRDIDAEYVYQVGDFRMNGKVVIDNLHVDYWYFDGIRIIGSGEEGYVEGDRLIAHVDLTNNLAVYNELGGSAPHPDNTQGFNSGSSVNNTNPTIRNLLFYRNRFNPGQLRSNNTQSGLTQTRMINVGYIENIWATKASPHGISLEGGASGVLIERNTIGDVNWASKPWVRIFRTDEQVLVADSYIPSGFHFSSNGNNANSSGFELDEANNDVSSAYVDFFVGPPREGGIEALVAMFTPQAATSIGALDTDGGWRGGAHRPMRSAEPSVVTGDREFTLTSVAVPSLQTPDQSAAKGDEYSRFDLRWSEAGANEWVTIVDVAESDVIDSVSSGDIEVQTRCVNSAGEGLWSFSASATVN